MGEDTEGVEVYVPHQSVRVVDQHGFRRTVCLCMVEGNVGEDGRVHFPLDDDDDDIDMDEHLDIVAIESARRD